jgi:NitT/TauT family transport system substrate-binding protein
MSDRARSWSRREFVSGLTLAGTAGLLAMRPEPGAAEPRPETTTLRLITRPANICQAPLFEAEALLRADGFTDVQYVRKATMADVREAVAAGEAHIAMNFSAPTIILVDAGYPIVLLAGVHPGCIELFGADRVRAIRDLKGKTVSVPALGDTQHVFISTMAAHVGLDPRKDINWVTHPHTEAARLLAEGKIDALLAGPPEAQELRAKKVGHVLMNTMMDRPWSQYFCCIAFGNREFVQKNPVATSRALRAILTAAEVCAREPERIARLLVERGYTPNYEYALQALKEMDYTKWREYDPEDTVRFLALRLQEAGMIKASPKKIIAQGTDWRFLNVLKKELKRSEG